MVTNGVLLGALVSGALVACSVSACSSQKKAEDASSAETEAGSDFGEGTAWADKSREQRMDWMGLEVFPKMKAAFGEHDSEGYADFACQTCHGDDMEVVDFEMPNSLYALPTTDTFASAQEYDAETTDFMARVVVPEMAKLLGVEPYNPETGEGFGCFGCHPAESD